MKLLKHFTDKYYRNAPMVSYWKKTDSIEAKVMRHADGSYVMQMKDEKYLFPGVPRGPLLFGLLSPLKHEIKNQIFNRVWAKLENRDPEDEIHAYLDAAWKQIYRLGEKTKYDRVPVESLCAPMKEMYRSMVASGVDQELVDIITFILQEDDAYRMRLQWMVKFFPRFRNPTIKDFTKAMEMAEEAEVVGDMKERQRLFRRIFLFIVKDSAVFQKFLKETDWKKMKLSDADKYFFRAKYFKVDYPEYQY